MPQSCKLLGHQWPVVVKGVINWKYFILHMLLKVVCWIFLSCSFPVVLISFMCIEMLNMFQKLNILVKSNFYQIYFFDNMFYKWIVTTHFSLMIFVQTVEDVGCKTKVEDTLTPLKQSVQAEKSFCQLAKRSE